MANDNDRADPAVGPKAVGASAGLRGVRVLLLAESAGLSLQVVMCLAQFGAEIHVLGRPTARQLRWSRLCKSFTLFDFHPEVTPIDAIRRRIAELAAAHRIDVAVPVSGLSAMVLDRLRAEIPVRCFPVARAETIERLGDKASFDALCVQHGVTAPKTRICAGRAAIPPDAVAAELGFPMVVKPANMGDSVGVVIARDADELRQRVIDNPDYRFDRLVVQQFVPGREIDLNVLAIGGRVVAHSAQYREGRTVVFAEDAALLRAGAALIAATAYDGLAHFDAIVDARDGRPYLLECNTRAWGSIAASAFCGLNFIAAGISIALGRPVPDEAIADGASFLSPPHALMRMLGLGKEKHALSAASRAGLRLAFSDPVGTAVVALTPTARRGRWP